MFDLAITSSNIFIGRTLGIPDSIIPMFAPTGTNTDTDIAIMVGMNLSADTTAIIVSDISLPGSVLDQSLDSPNELQHNIPVETNAEHSIVSQGCHKQVNVASALPKRGQRSIIEGNLSNSTAISMAKCFRSRIAAPQSGTLCQDEFQFWCRASSDQGPDQRQGVLVEVCLEPEVSRVKTTVNDIGIGKSLNYR